MLLDYDDVNFLQHHIYVYMPGPRQTPLQECGRFLGFRASLDSYRQGLHGSAHEVLVVILTAMTLIQPLRSSLGGTWEALELIW
jgi:hypothetical protein